MKFILKNDQIITPDTYYAFICKCGATITAKDKTYKCPACGNDAVLVGKMIRQYKDDE